MSVQFLALRSLQNTTDIFAHKYLLFHTSLVLLWRACSTWRPPPPPSSWLLGRLQERGDWRRQTSQTPGEGIAKILYESKETYGSFSHRYSDLWLCSWRKEKQLQESAFRSLKMTIACIYHDTTCNDYITRWHHNTAIGGTGSACMARYRP